MKSYIKIYGPPVLKAIKALEKVAIDMPEVCIMDTIIMSDIHTLTAQEEAESYFSALGEIPIERCSKIISKSGESLGEYDFFFEWFKKPTTEQLNNLIEKIDDALESFGCRYTITTKN